MFTDRVASTALGDRLGDERAQSLRRAHDRILGQQFERFGRRVVKGTGDGFMVVFGSARQGVECAVEVQRAIAAQQAEGCYLELQVRVGLHTGEPVAEEGDLFGSDVDLAARIESEAGGGQVLVSDLTRVLAVALDFSSWPWASALCRDSQSRFPSTKCAGRMTAPRGLYSLVSWVAKRTLRSYGSAWTRRPAARGAWCWWPVSRG